MRSEKLRKIVEEEIKKYPERFQQVLREGSNKIIDMIQDFECRSRIDAWIDGWSSAVKFGKDLYYGCGDADNFMEEGKRLLGELKNKPELVMILMPSVIKQLED